MNPRCCVGLAVLAALCASAFADVAPPPRPPAGWMDRVAPGFTPSIESVVVKLSDDRYLRPAPEDANAKLVAYWEGWGKGAVLVLAALCEDPQWEKFRHHSFQLLLASPMPEASDYVVWQIHALAGKDALSTQEEQDFRTMLSGLTRLHRDVAEPLLKELAASEKRAVLETVVRAYLSMMTDEGLTAAKAIIARMPEDAQKSMSYSLQGAESRMRANEPMKRILEVETAGRGSK